MNDATPPLGFHQHVPADTYHGWEAASKSMLSLMVPPGTPYHLRYAAEHGTATSEAKVRGDAMHALLLEPGRFLEEYRIAEQCSETTAKKVQCSRDGLNLISGRWYCGQHTPPGTAPSTVATIKPDELEKLQAMRKAVRTHPIASQILEAKGYTEASLVWQDHETGELVKARTDRLIEWDGHTIVDFKSTLDASPDGFGRSVRRYNYLLQAALYTEGVAKVLSLRPLRFVFIAVMSRAPYLVTVYQVTTEQMIAGENQYRKLLNLYHECRSNNAWPGYSDQLEDLVVPTWAMEDEVELTMDGEVLAL